MNNGPFSHPQGFVYQDRMWGILTQEQAQKFRLDRSVMTGLIQFVYYPSSALHPFFKKWSPFR